MWARLDDNFPAHPKILEAGAICELIQVRAICYCSRYLTDGYIPAAAVPMLLTGLERIGILTGSMSGQDALHVDWPSLMVAHGLWHRVNKAQRIGYTIHDFLDYNPSKKEIDEERNRKREAGLKGANSRWGRGNYPMAGAMADAMADTMAPATGSSMPPSSSHPIPKEEELHCSPDGGEPPSKHHRGNGHRPKARAVLDWLNRKASKNFPPTEPTLRLIEARLHEGVHDWQLKAIVSSKVDAWAGDPKMREYLRPKTLFNATNTANYLGELPKGPAHA